MEKGVSGSEKGGSARLWVHNSGLWVHLIYRITSLVGSTGTMPHGHRRVGGTLLAPVIPMARCVNVRGRGMHERWCYAGSCSTSVPNNDRYSIGSAICEIDLTPPHMDAFFMRCVAIRHDASTYMHERKVTDRYPTHENASVWGRP